MADMQNIPKGTAIVTRIQTWIPSITRGPCDVRGCEETITAAYYEPDVPPEEWERLCSRHAFEELDG